MARIRTIKPEFWTDEKVVALTPLARLLFIGMWNFVDDEGRGEYSPSRLKLQILPADSADSSMLLGEIRREELILVYSVDGKEYFQVRNFAKHQKVDKRTPSKYPPPPSSAEIPRAVPTEGKGRELEEERKGIAQQPEAVRAGAAKRTPADYDEIERLCRQAADLEGGISPSLSNLSPILTLLDKGYSLETDVLPVLKARKNPKARAWTYFVAAIEEQFDSNRAIKAAPERVAPPPDRQVFVAVDTPEWRAWQQVKRTPHYRSDEHKADGWTFPSRWPPGAEMHQ